MKKAISYYEGLKPHTNLDDEDLIYLDIRKKPFEIYGLYDPLNQPVFKRLPDEVAAKCNSGVQKPIFTHQVEEYVLVQIRHIYVFRFLPKR